MWDYDNEDAKTENSTTTLATITSSVVSTTLETLGVKTNFENNSTEIDNSTEIESDPEHGLMETAEEPDEGSGNHQIGSITDSIAGAESNSTEIAVSQDILEITTTNSSLPSSEKPMIDPPSQDLELNNGSTEKPLVTKVNTTEDIRGNDSIGEKVVNPTSVHKHPRGPSNPKVTKPKRPNGSSIIGNSNAKKLLLLSRQMNRLGASMNSSYAIGVKVSNESIDFD